MKRKTGAPTLRWEVLLVLLVGAFGTAGNAYVGQRILDAMSSSQSLRFPIIGKALVPIFGAIIIWVGYTVGLHLVSNWLYNSKTPVRRLFQSVAWALVPIAVGNIVRSVILFVVFNGVSDEEIRDLMAEETLVNDSVDAVFTSGLGDALVIVSLVILIGAILLSGYLMTFAVQAAKRLSRDEALRVVAVPVAVHVLYLLWTTVQSLGIV